METGDEGQPPPLPGPALPSPPPQPPGSSSGSLVSPPRRPRGSPQAGTQAGLSADRGKGSPPSGAWHTSLWDGTV